MNGLEVGIDEFNALPNKDKLTCLYENQCRTISLIKGYKLYYKITVFIGSILTAGMVYLFNIHLN